MVDTPWLRGQGIDPKSIHDYVARGWLKRVIRGVYRRPLPEGTQGADETSWEISLLSLQWIRYVAQVRLLLGVLPDIAREAVFAFKGGTVINLFYRDMPRLSVDIDLAYLPVAGRQSSLVSRRATGALASARARAGRRTGTR